MSTIDEIRQSIEPKKLLYCKRLKEPVITCNFKQCEYFGTCTEQKPYVLPLPQLQHILVMNQPLHRNNNGGHNKVEANQEMNKQDNILPASVIMMRSPATYLKEQIANGKCIDCEGTGYVFIENSTRNCSMCGGTGILNANSPCLSNAEGDREWRRMMQAQLEKNYRSDEL